MKIDSVYKGNYLCVVIEEYFTKDTKLNMYVYDDLELLGISTSPEETHMLVHERLLGIFDEYDGIEVTYYTDRTEFDDYATVAEYTIPSNHHDGKIERRLRYRLLFRKRPCDNDDA